MARTTTASLLAVAVACCVLATALAVDYSTKCTTPTASGGKFQILSEDDEGAPTCYYFPNSGATEDPTISLTYSAAMASYPNSPDYRVLVWNINQESGWSMTDSGPTASSLIQGDVASSGTNGNFGYRFNVNSASSCAGNVFDWALDVTGGDIGVVVYKVDTSDTDDDYYPVYTGDSSVTYKVIADAPYAYVRVMTPWTKAWQGQRKVTATVVASELVGVAAADLDNAELAWGDAGSLSVSTANTDVSTSGQVTFTWENYGIHTDGVPDAGALWVRIELCEITSECFFDWKTHGPFRTGSFSMTNTRIPELKDTWMLFDFDGSDETYLYARVEPTTHWQFGTLYYSIGGFTTPTGDGSTAGFPIVEFGAAREDGAWARSFDVPKTKSTFLNPSLAWPTASMTISALKKLESPYWRTNMVKVHKPACTATTVSNQLWLRVELTALKGDCMSQADCSADKDLINGEVSARGPDYLNTCVLMPKKANTGIPGLHVEYESRCIECDTDDDCDAGQYCYAFGGTCKDADNQWYICHEESATKFGTCQDKEDDVFGTSCGPQSCLAIWSESMPPYLTQNCFKQQLGEGANGNPNPNGYCGKLVYYNDSYVPHGPTLVPPAGFAMAKLWEGLCVAGKCAECDETATTNYGERDGVQCINGREVWARDNDWTIRTFTNNTIAGTALTGVVGIALILMCWCCFMVQSRNKKKAVADSAPGKSPA